MYLKNNEFLHHELAKDLLFENDITRSGNKLCIKHGGRYVQDVNLVKRKILEFEDRLTMRQINEVIGRLKIIASSIDEEIKIPTNMTPTLLGEISKSKISDQLHVKAWCPYCKKYHHHGYSQALKQKGESHLSAHCKEETPFSNIGYIIKIKDDHNEG